MTYKIRVSKRAQLEIEEALDFYAIRSSNAPHLFLKSIISTYNSLESSPHYRIVYRDVRFVKLRRFPHSLFFTIDEELKVVRILACFHNKRNPKNRP